jgi:hypothetical protein
MNEKDKVNNSVFEKALPVASASFGLLALFIQGSPEWVRYAASVIGVILAVAWLFSKTGWIGEAIKFRLFRAKLPKDQAVRLSVLLDEINDNMSYSFTLSPFNVWRNCSNEHSGIMKMNYSYYGAIANWLQDLREKFSDPRNNTFLLIDSLNKAISETVRLAEQVEGDLNDLLQKNELSDSSKRKIQKDWDSARNHFNQWIDKWQMLFKEIRKSIKTVGAPYIRPLKMIG